MNFFAVIINILFFLTRSREEESMLKKKYTNKNWDKANSIKQTRCSMITKIWLRLFIQKCWCAMFLLNNNNRGTLPQRRRLSIKKLICNGKSLKNKRWSNMMNVSVKSLRRNITKRWRMLKISLTNLKTSNSIISRSSRKSNLKVNSSRNKSKKNWKEKSLEILID